MTKLIILLGVFLLLTCAQSLTNETERGRDIEDQETLEAQQKEAEENKARQEEIRRGEIQDHYEGWEYDEAGHTSY